jgi:hypothetical protein
LNRNGPNKCHPPASGVGLASGLQLVVELVGGALGVAEVGAEAVALDVVVDGSVEGVGDLAVAVALDALYPRDASADVGRCELTDTVGRLARDDDVERASDPEVGDDAVDVLVESLRGHDYHSPWFENFKTVRCRRLGRLPGL